MKGGLDVQKGESREVRYTSCISGPCAGRKCAGGRSCKIALWPLHHIIASTPTTTKKKQSDIE